QRLVGGAQRPSRTCPLGQHPLASLTSPSAQPIGSGVGVSTGGVTGVGGTTGVGVGGGVTGVGGATGGGVGAGCICPCGGQDIGSQFAPLTFAPGRQHTPLVVTWVARQQVPSGIGIWPASQTHAPPAATWWSGQHFPVDVIRSVGQQAFWPDAKD